MQYCNCRCNYNSAAPIEHTIKIAAFKCFMCNSNEFFLHTEQNDFDGTWYECKDCHNYNVAYIGNKIKECFYFIDLNIVVVKETDNFIYVWLDLEDESPDKCVKLPKFDFTKDNFYSKFKTYTVFQ